MHALRFVRRSVGRHEGYVEEPNRGKEDRYLVERHGQLLRKEYNTEGGVLPRPIGLFCGDFIACHFVHVMSSRDLP